MTKQIGISHFAHASVAANEQLIERLSEIMETGTKICPFQSGQVGVESGSPRIIAKYMKGKVKPFSPDKWPETVIQSHKILKDNHWVPVDTFIMGLPGEKPEDILKSKELVEDLADYKSLIIPLYFVPIGNLQGQRFFRTKDMSPEHWQLLAACLSHTLRWMKNMADECLSFAGMSPLKLWGVKQVINYADWRLGPYLSMMKEGINPLSPETKFST